MESLIDILTIKGKCMHGTCCIMKRLHVVQVLKVRLLIISQSFIVSLPPLSGSIMVSMLTI